MVADGSSLSHAKQWMHAGETLAASQRSRRLHWAQHAVPAASWETRRANDVSSGSRERRVPLAAPGLAGVCSRAPPGQGSSAHRRNNSANSNFLAATPTTATATRRAHHTPQHGREEAQEKRRRRRAAEQEAGGRGPRRRHGRAPARGGAGPAARYAALRRRATTLTD